VSPARWLRDHAANDRLLAVHVPLGTRTDARVRDLPALLRPADLVVINDAATLPASIVVRHADERFELRLASRVVDGSAWGVAFGAGNWRTPTELRGIAPRVEEGDALTIDGTGVTGHVVERLHGRLVRVDWEVPTAQLLAAIYAHGRPIQYSHVDRELPLWAVQTPFASRPWGVEMASAGRAIGPSMVSSLRAANISVAWLTHAAGLTSTGDPELDAMLPLAEDFEIPLETVRAVGTARARGGRVIAVGTTVVRALESASETGMPRPGPGTATRKLDSSYCRRVVDGLLTGFHESGSTHLRLLSAFAPAELLTETYRHADREGYLCHELGDVNLILAS